MITTDLQWLDIFEKSDCTGGLLKKAGIGIDEIMLRTGNAEDILTEKAKSDLTVQLYRRLFGIYKGVLCELVKEKAGDMEFALGVLDSEPGDIAPKLLTAVNETGKILDEDPDLIWKRFPVLKEKEEKISSNFINATVELLERYAASREEISKKLYNGNDAGRIRSVLDITAITRQHGRAVTGFLTEQGIIYYKPRNCMVDLFFAGIIEKYFYDITASAKIAAGDDYAFCSQIKSHPVTEKEEIGRYFYRFGALSALLTILGGIDIHRGNIIANGGFPVAIDIENLFTTDEKEGSIKVKTAADNYVDSSVLRLSCLPDRNYIEGSLYSSLHRCTDETDCLPGYMGKKYEITGYEEEFIKGFSDGYDRTCRYSDQILSALEEYPDMRLRYLYNSPGTHGYILGRLTVPQNLTSADAEKEVLKRNEFSLKQRGVIVSQKILNYEERHLTEGDVPYYYVKLHETSLYGADGILADDILALSPFDKIKTKMNLLGTKDKKTQLDIIRHALDAALYDDEEQVPGFRITKKESDHNTVISEIKRIFDLLKSDKMYTPDGTLFFISSIESYYMQGRWGLAALQEDVILFCSAVSVCSELYEKHGACAELLDEALSAVYAKVLLWEKEGIPAEVPVGMRFGLGGLIFACACAKQAGSEKALSVLDRLLPLISRKPAASPVLSGFWKGNAGLLFALCFAGSEDKDIDRVRRACIEDLAGELIKNLPQNKASHSDLAGSGMSLIIAGKQLDKAEYINAGIRAFRKISENSDAKKLSADVGYFAATALEHLGMNEDSIFKCLLSSVECEFSEDSLLRQDILENGNALRVSFLLKADKYAPAYGCRKRAEIILSSMIDRKNITGEYISSPEKTVNHFDVSFFTGTLGVGAVMCEFLGSERGIK